MAKRGAKYNTDCKKCGEVTPHYVCRNTCVPCRSVKEKEYREANKKKIAAQRKTYRKANKKKIAAGRKAHYEANKEKVAVQTKAYYETNKEKIAAGQKAHYETNKEGITARQRVYREANKEKVASSQKAYYETNKEKIIAYQKAYREANPEKVAARTKGWREANPERKQASEQKRRALKAAANGSISHEEWGFILELHGKCLCCDAIDNLSMDHIVPLSKGGNHSADNAQVLCRSCNSSKGNHHDTDYRTPEQIEEVTRLLEEQWLEV